MSDVVETISAGPAAVGAALTRFTGRGAGTDAERRAALWLADALRARGRGARVETVWVRPRWGLVGLAHAVIAVAGGVLALSLPIAGAVVIGAVLLSGLLDLSGRAFLLRRLTPARATQNVVSPPPTPDRPVRLIVTAAYDAPRGGVLFREPVRRTLRRLPRPFIVLTVAGVVMLAAAGARAAGVETGWVGPVQLAASVILLVAAMGFVDVWLAPVTPGAGESASAAGVAVALVEALDRMALRSLAVELVLAGAGDGPGLGIRAYLRAARRSLAREGTVVLDVAPCGSGDVRWWTSCGPLLALPFHPRLAALCREVADAEPRLAARAHRGRSATGARPARVARLPAITIGCLGPRGYPPAARTARDTPDQLDPQAMERAVAFGTALVRALDEDVSARQAVRSASVGDSRDARTAG